MKFLLKSVESYLYELFMFPKLLYLNENEITKLNEVLDGAKESFLDHDDYMAFVNEAKEALDPYKDPLLGFYSEEAISFYDFPNLLFKSYSFFGFNSYKDYLNHIQKDSEETIKLNLIYALLTIESQDDNLSHEEGLNQAKAILHDKEKITHLIRQTPTTENHRWILMLLIENPCDYLEVFSQLLEKVEPIFNRFYEKHLNKIEHFVNDVMNPLKNRGEEAFLELTKELVPLDVLDVENIVLYSFVSPYRFSIMHCGDDHFIHFGISMKQGFEKIAEFEQNSRKNRAKVFKTLSDETRYEVLRALSKGVTSTKAIATELNISSATVTYHLNTFLTAKVIKPTKNKKARYAIDFERLEAFWQDFINDLKSE